MESRQTYLAVVHGEVEVVQRVVCGPVDDLLERVAGDHVGVVDEDGPEVDKDEEAEVEVALDGEEEDEQMVGHRLQVAVERVERVRREGSGD